MASPLALYDSGTIKYIATDGDLSLPLKGIPGMLLETAIGGGTSFMIGEIGHRQRNNWFGKNIAKLTLFGGKFLSLLALAATGGEANYFSGVFNTVGQAGVNAYFLGKGLEHARKATGVVPVLLPAGSAMPAGALPGTAIGELGATPPGVGLSYNEIAQYTENVV